jgi:hypothetical protein
MAQASQLPRIPKAHGELLEEPQMANTRERDGRGEQPRAVVEALDPRRSTLIR